MYENLMDSVLYENPIQRILNIAIFARARRRRLVDIIIICLQLCA